jgi:hypothetical protein
LATGRGSASAVAADNARTTVKISFITSRYSRASRGGVVPGASLSGPADGAGNYFI